LSRIVIDVEAPNPRKLMEELKKRLRELGIEIREAKRIPCG